jgi:hypothetical protein
LPYVAYIWATKYKSLSVALMEIGNGFFRKDGFRSL